MLRRRSSQPLQPVGDKNSDHPCNLRLRTRSRRFAFKANESDADARFPGIQRGAGSSLSAAANPWVMRMIAVSDPYRISGAVVFDQRGVLLRPACGSVASSSISTVSTYILSRSISGFSGAPCVEADPRS